MRQTLVVGNWKMNGSNALAEQLVVNLKKEIGDIKNTQVVLCPPFVFLPKVSGLVADSQLDLGAQNVCGESKDSGAYTGEVSADMLIEMGCQYVITGHSERRQFYHEAGEVLAKKVSLSLTAGLKPILCVGETLEQRESGQAVEVVQQQLSDIISQLGIAVFENMVLAYEPIWAIGTGKTATPEIAQSMHFAIRQYLAAKDKAIAENIQILYGGSVKPENAGDLFIMQDIDGALVGGACLEAVSFSLICKSAELL